VSNGGRKRVPNRVPNSADRTLAGTRLHNPDAFWGAQLGLPEGTELPIVAPSSDGTRGMCVFKSDSVDTVRNLVEGAAGEISSNEYHGINEGNAQGLPVY
jgi:hypothetical protein